MAKTVKMADIAAKLGVSTVTVSKALSGQKGVSDEVREKIVRLAEQLGYQRPSGKEEEKKRSFNIGVVVSASYIEKYATFYWELYQELNTASVQRNCFVMLEILSVADEKAMISTTDLAALIKTTVTINGKDIVVGNIERRGNLLRNSGFENGLSMDWVTRNFTRLGLSTDAHSGSYSIHAYQYQWGADGGVYQDIANILRQYGKGQYKITAWVKKASAECDSTKVGVGVTNEWSVTNNYTSVALDGDEWTEITYIYNYGGNPKELRGMILCVGYADGTNRDILIDDITMERIG